MKRKLLIVLVLALASSGVQADRTYVYDADVEGMVCAFCAYNVSKQIESLPGVERGSVDVNLDNERVQFRSKAEVDQAQLSAIVTDAGFSLKALRVAVSGSTPGPGPKPDQRLALEFDASQMQLFEPVLDAIGAIAADQGGQLQIRAPTELEIDLLKPLLAGRQRSIPVTFDAAKGSAIAVNLMLTAQAD